MDKLNQRRWFQLGLGLVVMMTISSPQYVWTLFVKPFQTATNASLAAVQVTFTVVIRTNPHCSSTNARTDFPRYESWRALIHAQDT